MKEAIILAGGLGTRLRGTVENRQKVMAPVGGCPFLAFVLEKLVNTGFTKTVLAVSYKYEQIKEYFGDNYKGMALSYSVEEVPLGTGGAIKKALNETECNEVAVFNGDTFFNVDINALFSLHRERRAKITLAAKLMPDCTRHSTLKIAENGRILDFQEKKEEKNGYINGGVYIINRNIFSDIADEKFSFEKEILEKEKDGLFAVKSTDYFIDMGIPEAYFRANTEIPLLFGKNKFRVAFLDRDGVICKEKHHLYKTEDFEFIDGALDAIEQLREMGYLIIIITNQAGVAKGLYTEDDVNRLHEFMIKEIGDKSHIDAIYYCPYHEDAVISEYKKASPDRKPDDGMIQKAISDLKEKGITADIENSILVGDKLSDIKAGLKAGVGKTVLVRSGHKIDESTLLPHIITDSIRYIPFLLSNDKGE